MGIRILNTKLRISVYRRFVSHLAPREGLSGGLGIPKLNLRRASDAEGLGDASRDDPEDTEERGVLRRGPLAPGARALPSRDRVKNRS